MTIRRMRFAMKAEFWKNWYGEIDLDFESSGTEIKDANDFSMYLLAEANVATVTGDAFGNPNCIRFSYATSEELLTEALRRIKEALAKLK